MNVEAEILQLLATYGPFAGQAAAQSLGTSAISGIKLLLQKITQKFHQKGEVAESAIKDFETTPNDTDTQALVLQLLRKFSREDPTFSQEITDLLQEVKNDPAAAQFTLLISGNANVGMAGQNYGQVTINQTTYQQAQRRVLSPVPLHIQLQALDQILGMFESRGFITQEELADYLATPCF